MAVTVQTGRTAYTGDGVTTAFATTFKVLQASHLTVYLNGVLTTNYTVGTLTGATCTITFTTAPASGVNVSLIRAIPYERTTNYLESGDLLAATLNDDIDRVVMMIQQLGQVAFTVQTVSATTATVVFSDATSAPINVQLPASGEVIIIKTDSTANTVTVLPDGSSTIMRQSSFVLEGQDQSIHLLFNGTNWYRID